MKHAHQGRIALLASGAAADGCASEAPAAEEWANLVAVPHTASPVEAIWDSRSIARGASSSRFVALATGGTYTCAFHPSMPGRITVQ